VGGIFCPLLVKINQHTGTTCHFVCVILSAPSQNFPDDAPRVLPDVFQKLRRSLLASGFEIGRNLHHWRTTCTAREIREAHMPERKTLDRARKDLLQGKAPTTQAGEFVREEIEHIREGKHGARSAKQAIAIGLSKARRAGVKLPPPKMGHHRSKKAPTRAARDKATGQNGEPSPKRSRAIRTALKRRAVEPRLTWRFLAKRMRVLAVAVHQAEAAQPSRLSERKAPRGFEVRRERPLGRGQLAEDRARLRCNRKRDRQGSAQDICAYANAKLPPWV
jgi:hypothetical protein